MPQQDTDSYEAISKRSLNAHDLDNIRQVVTLLTQWEMESTDWYPHSVAVTVASKDGYIIGEVWWDSEVEAYRIDFARYGEAA